MIFVQYKAASSKRANLNVDGFAIDAELEAAANELCAISEACSAAGDAFMAANEARLKADAGLKHAESVLRTGGVEPDAKGQDTSSSGSGVPPNTTFSDQWRSCGTKPNPSANDYYNYDGSRLGYGSGSSFSWGYGKQSTNAKPGSKFSFRSGAQAFTPSAPKEPKVTCAQWLAACKLAFADKASMTAFPSPPTGPCYSAGCKASAGSRALEACGCTIRDACRELTTAELKAARVMFHPDKFGQCPEAVRAKIQKAASEVFVVVEALFAQAR